MHRARYSPRRGAAVVVLVVATVLGVVPAAGQDEPSTSASAVLTQDGWWNRAKGPQPSEPANPLRSNIGGSVPAPSTVPESGLGVGALGGDPDKVAAVGLILDAAPSAVVDRLVLTLAETSENGSNLNTASAKIIACPIVAFWAGVKNGDFVNRPVCDDSQAVPGVRSPAGVWTFDLSLLAMAWLDPTSGLQQNGVLLVEAVDAPVSFQTSLADASTGKVTLDFAATDLGSGDEAFTDVGSSAPDETFTPPPDDAVVTDAPFDAGSGSTFDAGGATVAPPTIRRPSVTGPAAIATPAAPGPQVATPATSVGARRPVGLLGALPLPAVVLFVLLLAGVGLFLALVLGPMAANSAAPARSGGVSQALAARAAGHR